MKHTKGKGTLVWEHFAVKAGIPTSQAHRVMFTGHDPILAGRYQVLMGTGSIAICETDEELIRRFPYTKDAIKKATSPTTNH